MAEPGLILTVCTANICRSPMAAALLEHALKAQPEPLKSWRVASAGVAARGGERVSENSVTALKKVGINISDHHSQPLTSQLVGEAKVIFVMTESHRSMIQLMFDPPPKHVYLLREFMPKNAEKQIGDPYGGPLSVYEACRDEMVEAIPTITEFLKQLAASEARGEADVEEPQVDPNRRE
jgi:protein-tyrosine-phosphatase